MATILSDAGSSTSSASSSSESVRGSRRRAARRLVESRLAAALARIKELERGVFGCRTSTIATQTLLTCPEHDRLALMYKVDAFCPDAVYIHAAVAVAQFDEGAFDSTFTDFDSSVHGTDS